MMADRAKTQNWRRLRMVSDRHVSYPMSLGPYFVIGGCVGLDLLMAYFLPPRVAPDIHVTARPRG